MYCLNCKNYSFSMKLHANKSKAALFTGKELDSLI